MTSQTSPHVTSVEVPGRWDALFDGPARSALERALPAYITSRRWYRTKTNPSTADMLAKLRRTIIAAQYSPGRLRSPYREKINAIQQAWAAALL